jgi:uncharacterized protein (TIGR02246 family)
MNTGLQAAVTGLAGEVDAAYNAGDAAGMAACWTDEGLNITPFGDRFEGRASIEADLRAGLDGFLKGSEHRLMVSRVWSLNDQTTVADGTATISGIAGFDGTTMEPMTSSFSMICTRDGDGRWRISQMRAYRFIPRSPEG